MTQTTCFYGSASSSAGFRHSVVLTVFVNPKALTRTKLLLWGSVGGIVKLTSYTGLSTPAWYYTVSVTPRVTTRAIFTAVGRYIYEGNVYSVNVSLTKLADLTKLAEKL